MGSKESPHSSSHTVPGKSSGNGLQMSALLSLLPWTHQGQVACRRDVVSPHSQLRAGSTHSHIPLFPSYLQPALPSNNSGGRHKSTCKEALPTSHACVAVVCVRTAPSVTFPKKERKPVHLVPMAPSLLAQSAGRQGGCCIQEDSIQGDITDKPSDMTHASPLVPMSNCAPTPNAMQ